MESSGISADLGALPNVVIRRKKKSKNCKLKRNEGRSMLKGLDKVTKQILEAEEKFLADEKRRLEEAKKLKNKKGKGAMQPVKKLFEEQDDYEDLDNEIEELEDEVIDDEMEELEDELEKEEKEEEEGEEKGLSSEKVMELINQHTNDDGGIDADSIDLIFDELAKLGDEKEDEKEESGEEDLDDVEDVDLSDLDDEDMDLSDEELDSVERDKYPVD